MNKTKFNVFLPVDSISKSNKGNHNYIVEGYASTDTRDFQGEIIKHDGLDISYLMDNGFIDVEHDRDNICGVPLPETHVDEHGLFMKALLFGDNSDVQRMINLQKNFEDTGVNRNLGFSIEGHVLERDSVDESIVRSVQVTGCAITLRPANGDAYITSWGSLVKSINTDAPLENINKGGAWEAGSGISPKNQHGGAAMRTESLEGSITTLAEKIKKLEEQGVKANEMADKLAEELSGGKYSATIKQVFLQLYSGISGNGAKKLVNQSFNESDFQRAFNSNDADNQVDNDDDDDDND